MRFTTYFYVQNGDDARLQLLRLGLTIVAGDRGHRCGHIRANRAGETGRHLFAKFTKSLAQRFGRIEHRRCVTRHTIAITAAGTSFRCHHFAFGVRQPSWPEGDRIWRQARRRMARCDCQTILQCARIEDGNLLGKRHHNRLMIRQNLQNGRFELDTFHLRKS